MAKKIKHYFKLDLDLAGRPCLVVGGDEEAYEKTLRLHECGARVSLISPGIIPEIQAIARTGKIRHVRRRYRPGDEKGMYLVINCVKTDSKLSKVLFGACAKKDILISSYDQPRFSTATMSALVRAGRIRMSISSDGASPAIARKLRIELEKVLDRKFAKFVDWVADYRERMVRAGVDPAERRRVLRRLLEDFRLDASCRYPRRFENGKRPD